MHRAYFNPLCFLPLAMSCGIGMQNASAQPASLELPRISDAAKPRNIIFILSDDHRYDYMGFMKRIPWLETPNMDRMAREGAHLRNAFVTTSLCSPSRASILTGLFSHQHAVVDNASPEPENLVYFPQYLQKADYRTAFFGKWHMGHDSDEPRPGFDHWESFRGQGKYYGVNLNINGRHVQYDNNTYTTDLLTDHAIAWMKDQRQHRPGSPFFLYLSHKAVHDDFAPAVRHAGCYADKEVPLPRSYKEPHYGMHAVPSIDPKTGKPATGQDYYGEGRHPDWVKAQRESWHGVDYAYHGKRSWKECVTRYCETIRSLDDSIGRILDYLQESDPAGSTLVIYMGDNGFAWGEHGLIDKRHFYEESVRVPLLAWCPVMLRGRIVASQMIQNIDIAPTILAAAGLQKPAHMVGASFLPILAGRNVVWRDRIYYEYYWEYDFPQTPTMHGVRTDRYKLIRYQGVWDTDEFFDLQNDPDEMNNLIASPGHQKTIKQLTTDLYNWLETTGGMSIPLKRAARPHSDHRNRGTY